MLDDSELYALADKVFEELSERPGGFYYSEVAMHLEYMTGEPADDIEARLTRLDEELVLDFITSPSNAVH